MSTSPCVADGPQRRDNRRSGCSPYLRETRCAKRWIGLLGLRRLGLPQHVDIPLRVAIGVVLSVAGAWFPYHLIDKISALFEAQSRRYKFRDEILRSPLTSIAKLAVLIGAMRNHAGPAALGADRDSQVTPRASAGHRGSGARASSGSANIP